MSSKEIYDYIYGHIRSYHRAAQLYGSSSSISHAQARHLGLLRERYTSIYFAANESYWISR